LTGGNVLQAFIFVEGSGDKALKEAQEVAKEYKGEVSKETCNFPVMSAQILLPHS
jgi:hypothetical protein